MSVERLYDFLDGRVDKMDTTLRQLEIEKLTEELDLEMTKDEDDDDDDEILSDENDANNNLGKKDTDKTQDGNDRKEH